MNWAAASVCLGFVVIGATFPVTLVVLVPLAAWLWKTS
jgi:hypothetical protein